MFLLLQPTFLWRNHNNLHVFSTNTLNPLHTLKLHTSSSSLFLTSPNFCTHKEKEINYERKRKKKTQMAWPSNGTNVYFYISKDCTYQNGPHYISYITILSSFVCNKKKLELLDFFFCWEIDHYRLHRIHYYKKHYKKKDRVIWQWWE